MVLLGLRRLRDSQCHPVAGRPCGRAAYDALVRRLRDEVATLDVPYGETWSLQERWVVTADAQEPEHAVELAVCAHIFFKSRGMLSAKIKTHALKRSRKCAALAAELLENAAGPDGEGHGADDGLGGGGAAELASLREAHDALLEEAAFYRRQAEQLERENRRLLEERKHVKKNKRELTRQIADLEATLQKERRERAAMEEALTMAYSQALRDAVEKHESPGGNGNGGGGGRVGGAAPGVAHSQGASKPFGGGRRHPPGWFGSRS